MGTAEVRRITAAELRALLAVTRPSALVYAQLRRLDNVPAPTVLVGVERVTQGTVPYSTRTPNLELIVTVPTVDPDAQDDALDDFLDDVLDALAAVGDLTWSNADRATYLDAFPAYRITATREDY